MYPSATLSTPDPTWYFLELNLNFTGYRWAPDCWSHDGAVISIIKAVGMSINNLLNSVGSCKIQCLEIICVHVCHIVLGLN